MYQYLRSIVFIFLIVAKNRIIELDASSAPFYALQVSFLTARLSSLLVSGNIQLIRNFAEVSVPAMIWCLCCRIVVYVEIVSFVQC